MARRDELKEAMAALGRLQLDPPDDDALAALRQAFASRSGVLVAKAARITMRHELRAMLPDMARAFLRIIDAPAKSDPSCTAKETLVEAIYEFGADEEIVFARGIKCVQFEPGFGEPIDSAARLRGISAMGLARAGVAAALPDFADLLADDVPVARRAAARALVLAGREEGAALLRLKVHLGDPDPDVRSECIGALLELSGDRALPLVASQLGDPDPRVAEAAALALGGSRLPGAFELLCRAWERARTGEHSRAYLTGIALLRDEAPIKFLLAIVAENPGPEARDAVAALSIHRADAEISDRVRKVAEARDDVAVSAAVAEAFPVD